VRATYQISIHRRRPAKPASGVFRPFSAEIQAATAGRAPGARPLLDRCGFVRRSCSVRRRSRQVFAKHAFRIPPTHAYRTTLRSGTPSGLAIPSQAHAYARSTGCLRALRQVDPGGSVRRLTGRLVPTSDAKALIAPNPSSSPHRDEVPMRIVARVAAGCAARAQGRVR
jgi:hypothetical protein